MLGIIPVDLWNVLTNLMLALLFIAVSIWAFSSLWLSKHNICFPRGSFEVNEETTGLKTTPISLSKTIRTS